MLLQNCKILRSSKESDFLLPLLLFFFYYYCYYYQIFILIGKPLLGIKLFRKTVGVVKTVISEVLLTVNKEINNLNIISNNNN